MAISNKLLFRAGEIKQPKRREALIENAEKARISRQLVLLDDKVELDVPLDDLAVHEPDARKLIAFLKAMEFSTLTRRVADYSQIDPSDVEADAGNKSGASDSQRRHPADAGRRPGRDAVRSPAISLPASPATAKAGADKQDKAASPKGTPISLAAARAEAARKLPVDRSKYQTIRSLDELKAWIARAHDVGHFAIDAEANSTIRCRPTSAASRWRWRRTTPATSRSPTSNPAAAPACSTPGSRRTRSRPATRWPR